MTRTLHIHLLGQLRLFWGQEPHPFKALPKTTPLLAYLLLNRRSPVERAELAFTLWPDTSESGAKANLRRHLHALKQALPPAADEAGWILVTTKTVYWNPAAAYWLDVAHFEQLLHTERPSQLQQALAAYTDRLLPALDESWLDYERERLHALYLNLLEKLIQQHIEQAQLPAALQYAQQLLADDPFREETVRTIMLLHVELGDRARALHTYQQFARALQTEIGVPPMPETEQLAGKLKAQAPIAAGPQLTARAASRDAQPSTAVPAAFPEPLMPLVGRETDQAQIIHMLTASDSPTRLLSITGPGGSGKTRLAVEIARQLYAHHADRYPDGIFLIPLASINAHTQLLPTLAEALRIKPGADEDLFELLREQMRYKRLLIILDNFEHLLPAAPQVGRLLSTATELQLVVTSQAVLKLHGEQVFPLGPLGFANPEISTLAEIRACEAVRLFEQVARHADPHFELSEENALAVATICAQLDGLPLAVELAASHCRLLPLEVIQVQIQHNIALLTNRSHDIPERHRSLQAALQWSYDLLQEDEKMLFRRLALFPGSFTPAAVGFVIYQQPASAPDHIDGQVWQVLQRLADHHLIHRSVVDRVAGEMRFSMLSTIRSFAGERLVGDDQVQALQSRYVAYYAHLAALQKQSDLNAVATVWQDRYRAEEANVRRALEWAFVGSPERELVGHAALIVLGIRFYWRFQARLEDARPWLERLLQHQELVSREALVDILCLTAHTAVMQGQFDRATDLYEQAQLLAYELEEPALIATVLNDMGIMSSQAGRYEQAVHWYESAIALEKETNAGRLTEQAAGALYNLGVAWKLAGDPQRAVGLYQEFLAYARQEQLPSHVALGTISLSNAYAALDQFAQSLETLIEGLVQAQQSGDEYIMLVGISAAAEHAQRGELNALSVRLHSALRTQYLARNYALPRYVQEDMARDLAALKKRLGADRFIQAQRQGSRLKPEVAVQEALEGLQRLETD